MIQHQYNDGGRALAGYTGLTGDCVTRAIAIALDLPYQQVYAAMADGNASQRRSKHSTKRKYGHARTAAHGIFTQRKWFKDYMLAHNWKWTPTMTIGSGCKVHLRADELPQGRLIVALSRHYAAVIDGVLHDTHDCSRNGTRCVYGYWAK